MRGSGLVDDQTRAAIRADAFQEVVEYMRATPGLVLGGSILKEFEARVEKELTIAQRLPVVECLGC